MMVFRTYLVRLAALTIGILVLAVTVNVIIDPYMIFGTPRIEGLNARKPYAGDRGRMAKIHQVMALKPNGLIIGNSRPELGLDPLQSCWPDAARPVYNMGIPGLGTYAQVRYAQHAMAAHTPRLLLIGADFPDYLTDAGAGAPDTWWPNRQAEPMPLLVTAENRKRTAFLLDRARDYMASALSLDAFGHSLLTVFGQGDAFTETRTPLGMNDGPAIYGPIVRTEGTAVLFTQKNREMMHRLGRPGLSVFAPGSQWSPELEALERLLEFGEAGGSRIIIVINPLHAHFLLTIDLNGLWPVFQEWKHALTDIAALHNVELWDFAVVDERSAEPVSALKPTGESLEWFWEPAHYKKELGDLMLQNIFGQSCGPDTSAPEYGTRLTPDMLDSYLRRNRERLEQYKADHPDVVKQLRSLAAGQISLH